MHAGIRVLSTESFHLKTSADLHEFASKMQTTQIPSGDPKEN